jgi:hypothetical protein
MNDNQAEVHTHHLAEARAHHSFVMGFFALYPLSLIPFSQPSLSMVVRIKPRFVTLTITFTVS